MYTLGFYGQQSINGEIMYLIYINKLFENPKKSDIFSKAACGWCKFYTFCKS